MVLGLGPGIDYGAIGEAMAMGEAIASWQRAYDNANAEVARANVIIVRKNAEIERLQAEAEALRKRVAAAEPLAAKLAPTQRALEAASRKVAELEPKLESQDRDLQRMSAHYKEQMAQLRSDLHLAIANAAGERAMMMALVKALEEACPDHALLTPNGETGDDGEPLTGIDPIYEAAAVAISSRLGVEAAPQSLMTMADTARQRAIEAEAARRRHAAEPKMIFEERPIFG